MGYFAWGMNVGPCVSGEVEIARHWKGGKRQGALFGAAGPPVTLWVILSSSGHPCLYVGAVLAYGEYFRPPSRAKRGIEERKPVPPFFTGQFFFTR